MYALMRCGDAQREAGGKWSLKEWIHYHPSSSLLQHRLGRGRIIVTIAGGSSPEALAASFLLIVERSVRGGGW